MVISYFRHIQKDQIRSFKVGYLTCEIFMIQLQTISLVQVDERLCSFFGARRICYNPLNKRFKAILSNSSAYVPSVTLENFFGGKIRISAKNWKVCKENVR